MRYRKLGDTLYVKGRIGWKGLKKREYLSDGNYRIINGSNIVSNNIDWNNCGYVTEERYEESPEIMLRENDILITKDGTIGKVALVKKLEKPTTRASGLFLLRNTDPEKWDTLYLFYYLQSRRFKEFIHSRIEGSVIPHLYQKDFEDMKLPKVPLQVQKKIARKLDSIQRKIELNNRINANLVAC